MVRLAQGYPRPGIPSQPNLLGGTDKIGRVSACGTDEIAG